MPPRSLKRFGSGISRARDDVPQGGASITPSTLPWTIHLRMLSWLAFCARSTLATGPLTRLLSTTWSMPNASLPSDLKAAATPAVPQICPKEKVVCIVLLYQTRQTGHQFFDGHCCRTKLSRPKTCKPLQSLRILCDRLPSAFAWMSIQFAWARFHAMRPVRAFANWSPEDPRPFSQLFLSKLSLPLVKLPACGR